MPTLPTEGLYSARPRVDLAGTESAALTDSLLSVICTEQREGLARCEAVFGNWGERDGSHKFLYTDRRDIDFGTELAVGLGSGDRAGTVFAGLVSGIEAHFPALNAPEVAVLLEDRLQDLRMTRRTRSFEDASDDTVIRDVISAHGLTAILDIDSQTHRFITQTNQSDLAFLRDRARLLDADVWIEESTVHVVSRARRSDEPITLTLNADLHEVSVLADIAPLRTSVTVSGWDPSTKEAISYTADEAAISAELGTDISGISMLDGALGERAESLVHTVPLSDAEAQARAEAAVRTLARRFVTATGCSEGDARLRVGRTVELVGLGPGFTGAYHLTEVEHTFDANHGYLTRFRGERAGLAES